MAAIAIHYLRAWGAFVVGMAGFIATATVRLGFHYHASGKVSANIGKQVFTQQLLAYEGYIGSGIKVTWEFHDMQG